MNTILPETHPDPTESHRALLSDPGFRDAVMAADDPEMPARAALLERFAAGPEDPAVWAEAYARARQEEADGEPEFSEYASIPADALIELAEKVRQEPDFRNRYALVAGPAPDGRIWFDALTGFSRPDSQLALASHLDLEYEARGELFTKGVDLGAGTGNTTRVLAEFCYEAVGVDASPALLEVAARRPDDGRNLHVDYLEADVMELPFEDESVDVVTNTALLGALEAETTRRMMTEAMRILRPGGIIVNTATYPASEDSPHPLERQITLSWKNTLADMVMDAISGGRQVGERMSGDDLVAYARELGFSVQGYLINRPDCDAVVMLYHKPAGPAEPAS